MRALRFAHLADLHLDTPFRGLAAVRPDLAAELRDASLAAWDDAVGQCVAEDVDFVVIAGDVYDDEVAGVRAQLRFLHGLERLSRANIPAFVVHGNHDPAGGRWPAVSDWPPGVTVFGHAGVESVPVIQGGATIAVVHGVSYRQRHESANLALGFARAPEDVFQVGLLHANVGDVAGHGRYAPCNMPDLVRAGLDYWALGHVHERRVLRPAEPMVAYPGNLQARHPNETGAKGFLLVEVEPGAAPEVSFRPADRWRFHDVRVDLSATDGPRIDALADLQTTLQLRGLAYVRESDGRGAILRGAVTGASTLHENLARAGAEDGLLEALRDAAPERVWWERLRVASRPAFDRAERIRAGDFLADLLVRAEGLRPGAEAAVRAHVEGLRLHPRLAPVSEALAWDDLIAEAGTLWDEAERLAFDRLDASEAE
jgi:DNA repair protein SbcD/Mre11